MDLPPDTPPNDLYDPTLANAMIQFQQGPLAFDHAATGQFGGNGRKALKEKLHFDVDLLPAGPDDITYYYERGGDTENLIRWPPEEA